MDFVALWEELTGFISDEQGMVPDVLPSYEDVAEALVGVKIEHESTFYL